MCPSIRKTCKLLASFPQSPVAEVETFFLKIEPHRFLRTTSWDDVAWVILRLKWPLPGLLSEDKSSSRVRLQLVLWDTLKLHATELFPAFCGMGFCLQSLNWYIFCYVPLEFYLFLIFFKEVSLFLIIFLKMSEIPLITVMHTRQLLVKGIQQSI